MELSGLRLHVDADGVLADFTHGWVSSYNTDFPENFVHRADIQSWSCLIDNTHFETYDEFWDWVYDRHRLLFKYLKPIPGAVEGVKELRSLGHKIVIVTDKPEWAWSHTYSWLSHWEIPTDEVHITKNKAILDYDVAIDDGPHNLEAYVAAAKGTILRYVQPWNRPVSGTTDVHNWQDVVRIVKELW